MNHFSYFVTLVTDMDRQIFEGIVVMEKYPGKGGWTYAALGGLSSNVNRKFGMIRVKGSIDDYQISQYNLMPMGNGCMFLPVKSAIRKKLGKEAGDSVFVKLFEDSSSVVISDEIMACLDDEPGVRDKFLRLPESTKKIHIDHIMEVKHPDKRSERILKMMEILSK
ncbi:MAG: DUF1905 domain-containing protein [Saprospiraceae bacterium]|nr:DUF1905 domain-containing protein [Saprospiraceae bacterium]